jgi:heat shock protein HtpX
MKMYLVIALVFGIGFAVLYAIMTYLGFGVFPIILLAGGFFLLQWYISPLIIKWSSRLRYLEPDEHPELHEMVEELAKQSNVPVPRLAISESKEPNAFVFGRTRKGSTLVVHQGLLDILNKNEIRAVLGHEIGHLKHNDMVVITVVSFVPMLAYLVAENLFFSSMFGGIGGGRNNGGVYLILIGVGAFITYLFSQLLTLSLSRSRESYADIHSKSITHKPEFLASALVKITNKDLSSPQPNRHVPAARNGVVRQLCIVDSFSITKDIKDLKKHISEVKRLVPDLDVDKLIQNAEKEEHGIHILGNLFSTHPSLYRRLVTLAEND